MPVPAHGPKCHARNARWQGFASVSTGANVFHALRAAIRGRRPSQPFATRATEIIVPDSYSSYAAHCEVLFRSFIAGLHFAAYPTVPENLRIQVPEHCPHCGATSRIALETTITGREAFLKWCCRACGTDWPTRDKDLAAVKRPNTPNDPRKKTRSDGRRGPG
jgi:hypothetical protein